MRFIFDAQLPPALAALLKDHGYVADHVDSLGLRDADDTAIWDFALRHRAIIVTKDGGFPHHQAKSSPVIIWLRIGQPTCRLLGNLRSDYQVGFCQVICFCSSF